MRGAQNRGSEDGRADHFQHFLQPREHGALRVRARGGGGVAVVCGRGGVLAAQVLAADKRLLNTLQIIKLSFSLAREPFMGEAKIPV